MSQMKPARTRIERVGADRARQIRQRLALQIRHAREDAGLSQRDLARAAGVADSTLLALERGVHDPSTEVLARVGTALGIDLSMRFYPGTGPLVRDHIQAGMIEALLGILGDGRRPTPEVWVTRPLKGVIDLVLEADSDEEPLVAVESHSQLRRLEQQLRWSGAKAEALAQERGRPVSRLLPLRSTRSLRAVVGEYATTIRAAYPADAAEIYAALARRRPWPGAGILWCDFGRGDVKVRATPPRGITVGR